MSPYIFKNYIVETKLVKLFATLKCFTIAILYQSIKIIGLQGTTCCRA